MRDYAMVPKYHGLDFKARAEARQESFTLAAIPPTALLRTTRHLISVAIHAAGRSALQSEMIFSVSQSNPKTINL